MQPITSEEARALLKLLQSRSGIRVGWDTSAEGEATDEADTEQETINAIKRTPTHY
jgi:hypothetical protein